MKKILGVFLCLIVGFLFALSSGCYSIKEQTKQDIQGTYKLTRYYKTATSKDTEHDYIVEKGMTCFLVVDGSGKGYYVYKDNTTPEYAIPAVFNFEESQDNQGKYTMLSYQTEINSSVERLGVTRKALNKTVPIFTGSLLNGSCTTEYYIYTDYEKVDKATDLTYVKKQLPNVTVYEYGEYSYSGYFEKIWVESLFLSYDDADTYVYYYIRFDPKANKAKTYYMLKSDMTERTKEESYSVSVSSYGYGAETVILTIGGVEYPANLLFSADHSFIKKYNITVEGQEQEVKMTLVSNRDITDKNIQQTINDAVNEYNSVYGNN